MRTRPQFQEEARIRGEPEDERANTARRLREEDGIIVFGGGGNGCSGGGCLFWIILSIVLSVALTALVNLALILL